MSERAVQKDRKTSLHNEKSDKKSIDESRKFKAGVFGLDECMLSLSNKENCGRRGPTFAIFHSALTFLTFHQETTAVHLKVRATKSFTKNKLDKHSTLAQGT